MDGLHRSHVVQGLINQGFEHIHTHTPLTLTHTIHGCPATPWTKVRTYRRPRVGARYVPTSLPFPFLAWGSTRRYVMCVGVGVGVVRCVCVCGGSTYLVALVSFQINNNSHVSLARVCLVLAVSGRRGAWGKGECESVVSPGPCSLKYFYFLLSSPFFLFPSLLSVCFLCAALLAADTLPRLPHPWPGNWSALSRPVAVCKGKPEPNGRQGPHRFRPLNYPAISHGRRNPEGEGRGGGGPVWITKRIYPFKNLAGAPASLLPSRPT